MIDDCLIIMDSMAQYLHVSVNDISSSTDAPAMLGIAEMCDSFSCQSNEQVNVKPSPWNFPKSSNTKAMNHSLLANVHSIHDLPIYSITYNAMRIVKRNFV